MTIELILVDGGEEFKETYRGVESIEMSGCNIYLQGKTETVSFQMKDVRHFEIVK